MSLTVKGGEEKTKNKKKSGKNLVSPQLATIYSPYGSGAPSRTPSLQRTKSDPGFHTPKFGQLNLNDSTSITMKQPHLNISDELQPLKKRIMTVPTNLSEYHHPSIVLELLLNLPMECHMGIGDNLKPMIDKAIAEQTKLEHQESILFQKYAKQQQQQQKPPETPINDENVNDELEIVPAAPLAIPPTAPSAINEIDRDIIDSIDEIGGFGVFDGTKHVDMNGISPLRRRPSIKQFESVLQEGYTKNLMIAVIQALFGAFLSGYNTSVLNVPSDIIISQCKLSMNQYSALQSFYCGGGLVGALSIGYIADKFGRKWAIFFFDFFFLISGLLIFISSIIHNNSINFSLFSIARCLCGIGAGIATAIIPTYLGEISPPLIRGSIGTLNQMTVCIGLVIAEILGYTQIFGNIHYWPFLFILNIILPIIQIIGFWSFPESPKWLITQNKEYKARKVLQHLRECSNVDMDLHFTKLVNKFQQRKRTLSRQSLLSIHTVSEQIDNNNNYGSIEINRKKKKHSIEVIDNVHSVQQTSKTSKTKTIEEEEANRQLKQILFWSYAIAIGLQILQQFSGINSVFYYSNATLMNAGFKSEFELWIGNVLIAFANFLSVLLPVYLMDKWGRKTLLNISLTGMIFSSLGFSAFLIIGNEIGQSDIIGYISVAFLIFYVIFFELGLGPIPWLMMAEIAPSSQRAMIVSVATFINWGSNLCIAQFANSIIKYGQFFPFAVVCLIGIILSNKYVPETKGKTEMQIQQELIKQ